MTAPRARPPKPRLSSSTYPVRAPLLAWLTQEAAAAKNTYGRPRVLDVGCGIKPYEPLFAPFAASYVGVDVENPAADLIGTVEQIPVGDESQDVVLCTQVLEHALDPAKAVGELWRVTAPGGRVLASTHGVQVYHPSPEDYWRWTHAGLRRLFTENASWHSVEVRAGAGTASCLAMLLGVYTEIAFRRARLPQLAGGPVWLFNRAADALDRRVELLREPRPGSLTANFHVVATVGA